MDSFIEIDGQVFFIHRLRHYAKQGHLQVVQKFCENGVGIMADAAEGAIEGGHVSILKFVKDIGFIFPKEIATRVVDRSYHKIVLSEEIKAFLIAENVTIPDDKEEIDAETVTPQEDLTQIRSHSENLEAGLSIGESRRRLIRQAEFHRKPWQPNLLIYRNDLDTNLEDCFAGLSCIAEQLAILRQIKNHVGVNSPEMKVAVSRLRKQVQETRKVVKEVECFQIENKNCQDSLDSEIK